LEGLIVGAQFARYVEAESKSSRMRKVPKSYWFSYFLSLAGIFSLLLVGTEFGIFDSSPLGWIGDSVPIFAAVLTIYPGYRWIARRQKCKPI
jgi:hypothetical protein